MTTSSASVGDPAGARRPWPLLKSFAGYKLAHIAPDLLAGVTLAAVAIPEQIATARLGGLPPQLGFIAFIAATAAFIVFGSSRQVSSGADSTITPIFAGALALLAASGSPHYGALAAALGLLVGLLVTAAGALRMGWIGNLLSIPVTTGFLAGIAVHIIVSQMPAAMGLPALSGGMLHKIAELISLAPQTHLAALAIALGVLALIGVAHALSARIPGPLIAVGLACLAVSALHLDKRGVALLGAVSGGLSRPGLPALSGADYVHLAPLALLVALVVMVQTAATARSFPQAGEPPDVAGDFLGVGAGNLVSGLFGAFPVNASPPRTAIVAESGGRSQFAGLTALAVVLALLLAGTGFLRLVPQAALSGVLLFVALRIIRVKQITAIASTSPVESLLVLATAAGIVILPIESGVAIGVLLSLLHGLWSGARMHVQPMRPIPKTSVWWPISAADAAARPGPPGVVVLGFQAPLTFLNADAFARQFVAALEPAGGAVKLVVLEAAGIVDIDFTAAQALRRVIAACRDAGVNFAIARLESLAGQAALTRLGLRELIGEDHVFASVAEAIATLGPKGRARPRA
jgi:MFS superfamily sulfate permease-like transporter